MVILVVLDDNGSNAPIATEEVDLEAKCGIDDKEIPVERYADVVVAEAEDAVVTSISAYGEKDDNMGKLFLALIIK